MKHQMRFEKRKNQINSRIELSTPDLDFNNYLKNEIEKIRVWYNNSEDKINSISNLITLKNELDPFDLRKKDNIDYKKKSVGIFKLLAGFSYNGSYYYYRENNENSIDALDPNLASNIKELSIKIIDCIESINKNFKSLSAYSFSPDHYLHNNIDKLESLLNELNNVLPKEYKIYNGEILEIEKFISKWQKFVITQQRILVIEAFLSVILNHNSLFHSPYEISENQFNSENLRDKRGNPDFIESKWDFSDGFFEKAKFLVKEKNNYGQEGIYTELMDHFYKDSENKPSFSTVRRKLKDNGIW